MTLLNRTLAVAMTTLICIPVSATLGQGNGILLKPIPEKVVVLTFDDACASQATFVAPILKKYIAGPETPNYVVLRLTPQRVRIMNSVGLGYDDMDIA